MTVILGFLTSKLFALFGGGSLLGIGARILGFDKKAYAVATKLPSWVWIALAVVAALAAGYFVHRHQVHKFRTDVQRAQVASDNNYWKAKLAAAHADALAWKQKAESRATTISQEERSRYEETIRRNAADADALRLRGPGAATSHCGPVDRAGSPAGAGGHQQTFTPDETPGPEMPAGDWATVSWTWLVQVVTEHDDSIGENIAWRSNDMRQHLARQQLLGQSPAAVSAPR